MKKLKLVIYSRLFSKVLRPFYKLLFFLSNKTISFIYKKAKINDAEVSYFGTSIKFPPNTGITILTNLYWKGEKGFEYEIGCFLEKNIKKFNYFFDIGANFGFYSAVVSKMNPNLKIFSFEPLDNIYKNQLDFLKLNNINSKSENIAISDFDGFSTFYIPEKDIISEIHTATLNPDFFYNKQFQVHEKQVTTITLDSYVKQLNLNTNERFLVKLDVEGHELSAFKGAVDFLKKYKPVVICEIEADSESINELFGLVASLGYSFYFFNNNFLFKIKKSDFKYFKGAPNFLLLHESEDLKSLVINILGEV